MRRWTQDTALQFVYAFISALLSALAVIVITYAVMLYADKNSRDGQAGLGDFVEALVAGFGTFILVAISALVSQRLVVSIQSRKPN